MFIKLNVTQDDINKSRYIHQHIDKTHIDNLLLYFSMSCVSALIRCQIRSSESPPSHSPMILYHHVRQEMAGEINNTLIYIQESLPGKNQLYMLVTKRILRDDRKVVYDSWKTS